MPALVELLHRPNADEPSVQIGTTVVQIGRSPSNDVIVDAPRVSWHHAGVWCEEGGLWVRDRGSRNGVTVNGTRIDGVRRLEVGDVVSLGGVDCLRVVRAATDERAIVLRDLGSGVVLAIHGSLRIGEGPLADVRIADAEGTLHADASGVWLEGPNGDSEVTLDEPFTLGSNRFVVEHGTPDHVQTTEMADYLPDPALNDIEWGNRARSATHRPRWSRGAAVGVGRQWGGVPAHARRAPAGGSRRPACRARLAQRR